MTSPDRADRPTESQADFGCVRAICLGVPLGLGLWAALGAVIWLCISLA